MSDKAYLGDAVHVEREGEILKLTTEDGLRVSNTIYLEPEVYAALLDYARVILGWVARR